MNNMFNSLDDFIVNIHDHNIIYLNEASDWETIKLFKTKFISLFHLKNRYKLNLLKAFNVCFDKLENTPIRFNQAKQRVNFIQWIQAAQALQSYFPYSNSIQIKQTLKELERKVIALKYRLESANGGFDPVSLDVQIQNKLVQKAQAWKSGQNLFWTPLLNQQDVALLRETCRFDAFVNLLFDDEKLCDEFFNWTLRDGIDVLPFIAFPSMQKKIVETGLNGRIGRLGGKQLAVIKIINPQKKVEKILALKMDGTFKSILDENKKVTFGGNYTLTVKEIFKVFQQKRFVVGNLEMFENGITNWNSHHLGTWNPKTSVFDTIRLESPTWWDQLPILEVLSIEQAIKRYDRQLEGTQWIVSAKASREYLSLNFDKTHAYLEIAIPVYPGYYAIYIFGKFATKFPTGTVDALLMVTVSVLATIAYPDENIFYTQRQHIGYSFTLTPSQGKKFMSSIKADIIEAHKENSVFQMESENCGKWIQTKLEEHLGQAMVPNLYRTDLINSEPHGFLGICWKIIRRLPKFCRSKVLAWCHFPLGAWKGRWITDSQGNKVWKSLFASSFWQDGMVHLPSFLHNQMEKGIFSKKTVEKEKEKN
jgi:hypothetical protein